MLLPQKTLHESRGETHRIKASSLSGLKVVELAYWVLEYGCLEAQGADDGHSM